MRRETTRSIYWEVGLHGPLFAEPSANSECAQRHAWRRALVIIARCNFDFCGWAARVRCRSQYDSVDRRAALRSAASRRSVAAHRSAPMRRGFWAIDLRLFGRLAFYTHIHVFCAPHVNSAALASSRHDSRASSTDRVRDATRNSKLGTRRGRGEQSRDRAALRSRAPLSLGAHSAHRTLTFAGCARRRLEQLASPNPASANRRDRAIRLRPAQHGAVPMERAVPRYERRASDQSNPQSSHAHAPRPNALH